MKLLFLWGYLLCFQSFSAAANDFTPLIEAVRKKETSPYAIEALIKKGVYLGEKDDNGRTVLMLAAIHHPVDTAHSILIQNGADINARTPDTGQTALFFAVQYNTPAVVLVLLSNGADPEIKDVFGRTAYDYADRNPKIKDNDILKLFPQYKEHHAKGKDAASSSPSETEASR